MSLARTPITSLLSYYNGLPTGFSPPPIPSCVLMPSVQHREDGVSFQKYQSGASLVGHWLRLCAPKAGGLGLIPGQGTRSHVVQLKRSCTPQERSQMLKPRSSSAKYPARPCGVAKEGGKEHRTASYAFAMFPSFKQALAEYLLRSY